MAVTFSGIAGSAVTISGEVSTTIASVPTSQLLLSTNSTSRVTMITPASGKKIRIHSVSMCTSSTTLVRGAIYFGTGAFIETTVANAISYYAIDGDAATSTAICVWAAGNQPLGAADEVVSAINNAAVSIEYIVVYSEE